MAIFSWVRPDPFDVFRRSVKWRDHGTNPKGVTFYPPQSVTKGLDAITWTWFACLFVTSFCTLKSFYALINGIQQQITATKVYVEMHNTMLNEMYAKLRASQPAMFNVPMSDDERQSAEKREAAAMKLLKMIGQ